MFNFVLYSNKREEKLVTPVLIDSEENDNRRKVLGIHIEGDEKIQLLKRWGDPYDRTYDYKWSKIRIQSWK